MSFHKTSIPKLSLHHAFLLNFFSHPIQFTADGGGVHFLPSIENKQKRNEAEQRTRITHRLKRKDHDCFFLFPSPFRGKPSFAIPISLNLSLCCIKNKTNKMLTSLTATAADTHHAVNTITMETRFGRRPEKGDGGKKTIVSIKRKRRDEGGKKVK